MDGRKLAGDGLQRIGGINVRKDLEMGVFCLVHAPGERGRDGWIGEISFSGMCN
jgi:hypothetical protein